jgi:blue copper oxidase
MPASQPAFPCARRQQWVEGSRTVGGMGMMTINGRAFDMARVDHRVRRGDTELWEVIAGDMAHPFHVHGTSFQVLSHNGAPVEFASSGWKDTVLVDAGMMGQFVVT